jgi:hypothetical protein
MLEKATRLCEAEMGTFWTYDGEYMHATAVRGASPLYAEFLKQNSHRPSGGQRRLLRGERVVQIADITEGEGYRSGDPLSRAGADLGGIRALLVVPLRKDDAVLGSIGVYRQEVRPFSDKQIALLENFAAQAVIAMENARLMTETCEALDQQTATAEVLQVINSSPGDLAPVFGAMLDKAHALCGAAVGSLATYDGEQFRVMATHGYPAEYEALIRQPFRAPANSPFQRLVDGERFVHVPVAAAVPSSPDEPIRGAAVENVGVRTPLFRALVEITGIRTQLLVPLRKDGVLLHHSKSPGSAAVRRQADRAAGKFRGAGADRDGERAAVDRDARGVGAADRDCRGIADHQFLARRSRAGVRCDAGKSDAVVRSGIRRVLDL